MDDLKADTGTLYAVIRHANGVADAVSMERGQVLHLGAGASIVWSGSDEAAWKAESLKAGVPQPEPVTE